MKKGVTLIEILVSALILTIGISGILYSFVTCNQIVINNTHRHNAVQIINGHFEEIQRCESPAALNDYLKLTIGDSLLVKKQIINNNIQEYFLKTNATDLVTPTGISDLSVITATVSWVSDPNSSLTMSIFSNEPD